MSQNFEGRSFETPGENPLGRNPFAQESEQPEQGADSSQTPDVVDATTIDGGQQDGGQSIAGQRGAGRQNHGQQNGGQPLGAPRHAAPSGEPQQAPRTPQPQQQTGQQPGGQESADQQSAVQSQPGEQAASEPSREQQLESLVNERTTDLQRLQAEYVNYKKRVDRDRALSRQQGTQQVVADLLPILDSIELARQHGDMNDGFQMVADSLESLAKKHGLVQFGEVGEPFDPVLHEALMEQPAAEPVDQTTVTMVMQKGYKLGDRVLRPARVGVANPS